MREVSTSSDHVYPVHHLHRIRAAEMETVERFFRRGEHVLELGGADGFQASVLVSMGCLVTSLDVAPVAERGRRYFCVQAYDGVRIPAEDATFDVIFSSNVLEHVHDLDATLRESQRVLKPDGLAIHILPTPAWRLWTSIAHYGYLVQRILNAGRPVGDGSVPSLTEKMHSRGMLYAIGRILVAGPHGNYPNALSEFYYFSGRRWLTVFRRAGFRVIEAKTSNIFYTGYGLLPGLSLRSRKSISNFLGAATRIYVLRKA